MIKAGVRILVVLLLSILFYGNIYFWIDENGIKHFTNLTPPLNETVEELKESNAVVKNQLFRGASCRNYEFFSKIVLRKPVSIFSKFIFCFLPEKKAVG